MTEYDAKTGESSYPNESDEAREAREKRERAGVGVPRNETTEETDEERRARKDRERAEHKGQHSTGE